MIYTRWRDFEALRLNFDRNTPPDQNLRRGYLSTWTLRFGADYKWRKNYILRVGAFHDPTPVPEKAVDPILPDSSGNGFSAGFGYEQGRFKLNIAYTAELFSDRVSPLNNFSSPLAAGTYSNHAHLLTFGFGYNFSK
jgi:long-subunit fatty acid transport protein